MTKAKNKYQRANAAATDYCRVAIYRHFEGRCDKSDVHTGFVNGWSSGYRATKRDAKKKGKSK